MKKPKKPEFPRPMSNTTRYASLLSMRLQYLAWQKYDLAMLAYMGVITEEEVDAGCGVKCIPASDIGHERNENFGCVLLPTPIPEGMWEKIAGWHQKPHRELDPSSAEFCDVQADQLAIYYGEDDPATTNLRNLAEHRRQNPITKPSDPVRIADETYVADNSSIKIETDDERKTALANGKAQERIRRHVVRAD